MKREGICFLQINAGRLNADLVTQAIRPAVADPLTSFGLESQLGSYTRPMTAPETMTFRHKQQNI